MAAACCPTMDQVWVAQQVESGLADVLYCTSCGTVHRTEKYQAPLRFPRGGRCVNCSGDRRELPGFSPDAPNAASLVRCTVCGKTAQEDKELHDKLATLHPARDYLKVGRALRKAGRRVLALKMANAEVNWGPDPIAGMCERLEILDEMGLTDRSIDEGYEWSDLPGCPTDVWALIAQLEAGAGNVPGAIRALDRGLQATPDRADWWTEMAELLVHSDDRPAALRAAARGLIDPANLDRGLAVIAEVAERYYGTGIAADALAACSVAGNLQEKSAELCWMRARIAANSQDLEYQLKWLRLTVEANPLHAEATAMLERYDRPEKKGWKIW